MLNRKIYVSLLVMQVSKYVTRNQRHLVTTSDRFGPQHFGQSDSVIYFIVEFDFEL